MKSATKTLVFTLALAMPIQIVKKNQKRQFIPYLKNIETKKPN